MEKVKSIPMELPLEDGSSEKVIDAANKEAETVNKDTEKELKNASKIVDEINNAEEEKPELKDGAGKALKIKNMTEKLVLDETPENSLNESLDEDVSSDFEGDFDADIFNSLAAIAFGYDSYLNDMSNEEIKSHFDRACNKFLDRFFEEKDLDEDVDLDTIEAYVGNTESGYMYKGINNILKGVREQIDVESSLYDSNCLEIVVRPTDGGGNYLDEKLDEALPKDLAKVYKNRPYAIGAGKDPLGYGNIKGKSEFNNKFSSEVDRAWGRRDRQALYDFENSNYEEITPEEAIKLKKAGEADKLRIIYDGQLVAFTPEGKPRYKASRNWSSDHNLYNKKDGSRAEHTTQIPFKNILDGATKIYKADEKAADIDLQKERSKNPESAYYSYFTGSGDTEIDKRYNLDGRNFRGSDYSRYNSGEADRVKKYIDDYTKDYKDTLDKIAKLKANGANNETIGKAQDEADYLKLRIKDYSDRYTRLIGTLKDAKAFRRNISSQANLQKVFHDFKNVKDQIKDVNWDLNRAKEKLEDAKAKGSPEVQRKRKELADAQAEIKYLRTRVAELEMYLESADEDNEAVVNELQSTVDGYSEKLTNLTNKIDAIKNHKREDLEVEGEEALDEAAKVISTLDNYKPWSGAVDTYDKIYNAGKIDELDALIDELYPEGIDETQLNDILWYESDWVLDNLGLQGEEDE